MCAVSRVEYIQPPLVRLSSILPGTSVMQYADIEIDHASWCFSTRLCCIPRYCHEYSRDFKLV